MSDIYEQKINSTEISLSERNAFQVFLMMKMGIKHGELQSQMDWVKKYAKKVGDIIDNMNGEYNKKIRTLIKEGNYEEASESVLKILMSN